MEHRFLNIWDPETGITGLSGNWQEANRRVIQSTRGLRESWKRQQEDLKDTPALATFHEQMMNAWAIETGVIENLYSIERGVTNRLIESGFNAEILVQGSTDKPASYVIALLRDQRSALDGVYDFIKRQRGLTPGYIKELHAALVRSQDKTEAIDTLGRPVLMDLKRGDWKEMPNYPEKRGVQYRYCPPEHVFSEMDRLTDMYDEQLDEGVPAVVRASWLHHRFTQIHPFQDGNGRVARALATLVLVQDNLFPFLLWRDDKDQYFGALEQADACDLTGFVQLVEDLQFRQFRKATVITDRSLRDDRRIAGLTALKGQVERAKRERESFLADVVRLARTVEEDVERELEGLAPLVAEQLEILGGKVDSAVSRSSDSTDHYFYRQIIDLARNQYDYSANVNAYKSWVQLRLRWTRKARLVFAVHGMGRPFYGGLICAPFLEIHSSNGSDTADSQLIPVAKDGFIFFHSEENDQVRIRFKDWRENVLNIALNELARTYSEYRSEHAAMRSSMRPAGYSRLNA